MGKLRTIRRIKIGRANKDELELARDLAKEAFQNHEEGVQFASDILNKSIEDIGAEARKEVEVAFRPYNTHSGHGTLVSLQEETPEGPRHYQEILVATKPDKLAATDKALATSVGFTTKAITFMTDDDGTPLTGFVIFQKSTDPVAVGIQTAFSDHL